MLLFLRGQKVQNLLFPVLLTLFSRRPTFTSTDPKEIMWKLCKIIMNELVGVLAGRKYSGPFHPRRDTGVLGL